MYVIKEIKDVNPALNQVVIKNKKLDFYSIIYPNLGASLQNLSSHGIEIIDGIAKTDKGLNSYKILYNSSFLFPFPGRIPSGKYSFNNVDYELDCNETDFNTSLHGHIYNKIFSVKLQEINETKAVLMFRYSVNRVKGFPFSYLLDITYTFTDEKLTIDFTVYNNGNTDFPFGIGWHPYFKTLKLNDCLLDFDAKNQYLLNEKLVPERIIPLNYTTPLLIMENLLDDCFIIKKSEASFKTNEYDIKIDFSSKSPNSFLQVYTPPSRSGIAIEPMTSVGNCFNNKIGLQVLEPNKSYQWHINMEYSCKI